MTTDSTDAAMHVFAPRRVRADRQQSVILPPTPTIPALTDEALTQEIRDNALRVSTMVGNLQERERKAQNELAQALARIEQFEARVTELTSQVKTAELRTDEANARTDAEKAARIRLSGIIENIGGLVEDGLA